MTVNENDWRMRNTHALAKDWTSPWTGQVAKKGTQLTLQSVVELRKGKTLSFAVPNATAMCLNIAYRSWDESRAIRNDARIDKSLKKQVTFDSHGRAYDYIERVMESVVMAFTALEAFVNEIIPDNYTYTTKRRSDVILEVMNKEQIERWLSLDEKLDCVLPQILSIPTPKGKKCWSGYKKLKKARDRIIHMKSQDRRSSGPAIKTLWHAVFHLGPPHIQAKEVIDYFAHYAKLELRWHREYPYAT